MKLAILQMADTPQIESTAFMLRQVGYEVKVCGRELRSELVRAGCDTVLSVASMVDLGYDELDPRIGEASLRDMERADLFVEIKVRNVPKIVAHWPRLAKRIAWWRVNGAQPEICPKGGDEVHVPCPVITACLWYLLDPTAMLTSYRKWFGRPTHELTSYPDAPAGDFWGGMAYTFWPPYPRSREYDLVDRGELSLASKHPYDAPYCLAHSGRAWGYGSIVDRCVERVNLQFYGNNSPRGQISHRRVVELTSRALCMVHLKSVDCPGWALYEAMLSGCPVVTGRLLNSRMLAYPLLEHGKTCYEFGGPATEEFGRGDMRDEHCLAEIKYAVDALSNPEENRRIGDAGRERLNRLMWRPDRDGEEFGLFMHKHYGR